MDISVSDAKSIKDYLFNNESYYDISFSVWRRFDADPAIAQSWQRLAEGEKIFPHDKTLIQHEMYEMKIKNNNPGISHEKAHRIAAQRYDYDKESKDYYGNLRKSKKRK